MSDSQEQLAKALRAHGQSVTKARQTVFGALQGKEPQTMSEVVSACHEIDRASVYRTISLFESLGIVRRLQIGWKYKLELTDAFHHHHHHLSCVECGGLVSLSEDVGIENRLRQLAIQHGYTMEDHQLEIQGVCKQCQA